MLEGLATWFLNNYLGKYLQNLNTDQLSIALLSGQVELENVPLRSDALRFLNSSLEVRSGLVGKISLRIPVSRIRSERWSISLEQVYIVTGPQRFETFDPSQDDQLNQELKLSALDGIEAEWRVQHDHQRTGGNYYPSYSSWMSYGTSFIGNIVENLQIQIRDVHIRYEDNISCPERPFACGFHLGSLSAQACDENGVPKFVHRDPRSVMAFKLVELNDMSAYLSQTSDLYGNLSPEAMKEKMSFNPSSTHEFILNPVSAQAKLKRDCSEGPLNSRKTPRVVCDLKLDCIPLEITDEQYQCLITGGRSLHQLHKNRLYWKWRPCEPVHNHAGIWWRYAIACHMERIRDRNHASQWSTVLEKATENVLYVEAFKSYLVNPVNLSAELKAVKDEQDEKRSFEELKALRDLAVFQLKQMTGGLDEGRESRDDNFFVDDDSPEEPIAQAPSLLQQYFPSWYSSSEADAEITEKVDESIRSSHATGLDASISPLEEEFIEGLADDIHIVPYKDLIFAQINFVLKRGSFKLFSKRKTYESLPRHDQKGNHLLFELEFNTVKLNCETRPRTRSYKFALSLGGMYLRDMITKESMFPLLISPLNEQNAPLNSRPSTGLRNFEGIAKSFQSFLPKSASKVAQETPLFNFHYETRPFGPKKVDGKLHISSQPLNIVYNPSVLCCLSEFFKIPDELNRSAQLSAKLRSAAYVRIEEAKQKTKEEFLKSFHSILDGHDSGRRNWDILCELSAPQIVIPEHFVNKEALIMVIDLGKFHFSNGKDPPREDLVKANEDEDDEDEEFCTPASSPGSPMQQPSKPSTDQDFNKLDPNLMESTVLSKMYDRFTVSMKDMQVIIGRVKDNWRYAHFSGSSSLHVLNKFSISLIIDIRVVAANDPQMPSIVISGTLPKLNVHLDEEKIQSLERMTRLLILGDAEQEETSKMSAACQTDDLLDTPMGSPNEDEDIGNLFSDWNSSTSEVNPAATLLVIQFCVSNLVVELKSQEKGIVELQVTGVKACLTKRPFDTNITLSVMSLLLVDALQTFGKDFELLVASHRHVMVDSLSGSLRGSEPVSPMSPSSPDPRYRSLEESALDIKRVLSSLQSRDRRATSPPIKYPHSPRHLTSPPSFTSPHSNRRQVHGSPATVGLETGTTDAEALIMVDILIISPNCPTIDPDESGNRERHQVVSIHFNSLDVIANQETIIELLAFFKRVSPSVARPSKNRRKVPTSDCACQTEGSVNRFGSLTCLASTNTSKTAAISASSTPNIFHKGNEFETSKIGTRLELRAEFQRLNILLLRAKTGKRIGTFLLTEASVHSVLSKGVNVSGSLGGMQVMNLLSGSTLHQKIMSVGKDPMIDDNGSIHSQIYTFGEGNEEKKALTFSISQRTDCTSAFQSYLGTPMKESTSFQPMNSLASERLNIDLNIKMAAVCYVHTASFLDELNSCAADFKLYISNLAHSIRMAATEIALGIVHRRSEAISHQATMDEYFGTLPKAKGASFRAQDYYPSLERGARITAPAPTPRHESKANYDFDLHLDVVMESPIIVIPRHERSFEVLVAHLGEISVCNEIIQGYALEDETGLPHDSQRVDRVEITITDMNLHSLTLTEKYDRYAKDHLNLLSQFRHLLAQELYSCKSKGALPIWHDTTIDIRIDRIERFSTKMSESESFQSFQFHGSELFPESGFSNNSSSESIYHVKGKVTNPLKLSLYRSQYELLQDGVKNMALPEEISDPEADLDDPEDLVKPGFNTGLDPQSGNAEDPSEMEGSFEVPQLILELRGDLVNPISQGDTLVRLKFQDFAVFYDKTESYKNSIEIALKSVLMEDLQLDEGSKHRFLMSSSFKDQSQASHRNFSRPDYGLSTSCPDFWFHNDIHTQGTSLPDNLDPKVVIGAEKPHPKTSHRKRPRNLKVGNENPLTPPPSAVSSRNSPIFNDLIKRNLQNEDNLIHIKVLNIDKRGPDYYKKYKCTNRFVDVNFNTLDIVFNLKTWVMVLDFFGIGAGPSKSTSSAPITRRTQEYERSKRTKEPNSSLEEDFNTEINMKVKHLSLILNKPEYEVASAGVRNFVSCLYLRNGNFSIEGKLGQFSLKDLTPHNSHYKDRFLSRGGEQVLTFHFFKYTQDDDKLGRPYDASLKLRMASVTYVHTHRFYSEILVFFNQFHVHQSVMNSMRDVAAGGAVKDLAGRGTRIKLDIEAGSPLILLPMSSNSSKILSVDLGFLEIRNTFQFSGEEGTISRETLASCTSQEVLGRRSRGTSQTSRSTARSPDSSGGRSVNSPSRRRRRPSSRQRRNVEESSAQIKVKKCLLDVMNVHMRKATLRTAKRMSAFTDDNALAKDDILVGSFIVRPQSKPLLKETFELKLQVERNLDKAFTHRVPDTSVKGVLSKLHFAVDQDQYTMIRGLLAYNFGEPLDDLNFETAASEETHPLSGQTWTGMFMEFELQDVILDLLQHHGNPSQSVQESGLARVNFIQSRLMFEGSSDSTTDVDLVSQEILLSDLRFVDFPANKKSNVFSKILFPMEVVERRSPMQAEVHFRATPNFNQFTVLLNNMRLMCIFDWWIMVLDFISKSTQNPRNILEERYPESNEVAVTSCQPTISRSMLDQEPLYATAGVISRRAPIFECSGPVFELKLNITESETIIVADSSQSNTSTVILRSTTVVTFRPDMVNRPFSCNLNNAEVFSCILGREDESSLSIIDPVTINLDIGARNNGAGSSKGLADFTGSVGDERTAEVHLQQINIRLSYNDWLMFTAILDSFPKQAREAIYGNQESRPDGSTDTGTFFDEPTNVQSLINQLANLGFRREDCAAALKAKGGQLDAAALWLIENASPDLRSKGKFPDPSSKNPREKPSDNVSSYFDGSPISFSSFELKASSVNICIIDDCKDADVPLLETTLRQLHLAHGFAGVGRASTQVSGSYYNRALSAWEPFLEPWVAKLRWELKTVGTNSQKLAMHMTTFDSINFNLTSTLVDLYQVVKENWTEDLQKANSRLEDLKARGSESRHRMAFVPYALTNNTGSSLMFCTQARNTGTQFGANQSRVNRGPEARWVQVDPGETAQFTFENRGKLRHTHTHDVKIHQVIVKVHGWQEISPVSVDRVGTYFREANPVWAADSGADPRPARIVCDVTLEGSARKLITVRSALQVTNALPHPMDLKLETALCRTNDVLELVLHPGETRPIPLTYVWSQISAKPSTGNVSQWQYCEKAVDWVEIMTKQSNSLEIRTSLKVWHQSRERYRFCVAIQRENYPIKCGTRRTSDEQIVPVPSSWIQPAHRISLVSPIVVVNLLPCHLMLENTRGNRSKSNIAPGKEHFLPLDISQQIVLHLSLDQYPNGSDFILPSNSGNFEARIKLTDQQERPLFLQVRVTMVYHGAVKISVYAPIWLVNKTGIPLIFKQEGSIGEAAGQDVDHEVGRMGAPLLFSFLEREGNHAIMMRVGNELHPYGKTTWCKHFYIQLGARVRKLRVIPPDLRAEWIYIIGIEVRLGKGRYRDTFIVTLAPRFQIHNQTQYTILLAQKRYAVTLWDPEAEATHLKAMPNATLSFHWPRLDIDQLLCIRLIEMKNGQWSGGFVIEGVNSFHVSTRDNNSLCVFVRVEIGLIGATYSIIFADPGNFPPPFRIDNFSEVPITYYQKGIQGEGMHQCAKPRHSLPYAWDEPTLPPELTIVPPGGVTYNFNMNLIGDGDQVTYENFIYIAMSGTFQKSPRNPRCTDGSDVESMELVFDVEGTKVILAKKEAGKRSQLWRMTSKGELQHEGSSAPQDPKKSPAATNRNILVLDIGAPAVQPKHCVQLILRKPDDRRQLTQHWQFTKDGRMMCDHHGLYVQAQDGFLGLQQGANVALGPPSSVCLIRNANGIPLEQAIERHRLRPGSGFLSVKITTDGPTRVLEITDAKQNRGYAKLEEQDWRLIQEDKRPTMVVPGSIPRKDSRQASRGREFQIVIEAKKGVGLSLVCRNPPEELLYAFMTNVVVDYQSSSLQTVLDGSVQHIQIDNQLHSAQIPVLLYLSPMSKNDDHRHMPAIHFTSNKSMSKTENAVIYKHLIVTVKNMTINLEEELLCRVLKFAGITRSDLEMERLDESASEAQRALIASTTSATRYYFGLLKLGLNQVKLSVIKSNKLAPDLQAVKRKLGLSLITFEDANIELDPFVLVHPFETINFLTNSVIKHYQDELLSQAVLILGSTDFLGNPLGFLNDLTEGVSGLVIDGNVTGLIRNVAHGAANSAAKVTGTLSSGLSRVTLEERYDERRLMIRRKKGERGKEHLVAGLKGLGFGMLGGLTSVVTETYDGVANDGITGLFTGLGWGLIGTISKPAIGVLDLATGAATAVRESSRSSFKQLPPKTRPARVVVGPGGSMPVYSEVDAQGQELMYRLCLNGRDSNETYVAHQILTPGDKDLQIMITSDRVILFSCPGNSRDAKQLRTVALSQLLYARAVVKSIDRVDKHYIEMVISDETDDPIEAMYMDDIDLGSTRPQFLCASDKLAAAVCQKINYAKVMFEERIQAVIEDVNLDEL